MSNRHVLIVGAGIIGLCTAYYALQKGFRLTVVERGGQVRNTTSFGNAGMVVPSHIVPLAAPGAVAQGIRWMTNRESPFWVRPSLDPKLWRWGYRFWRSATEAHVQRSAPLLHDLNRASLQHYHELACVLGSDIGFHQRGLLMLCRTPVGLEEEVRVAERAYALGMAADVLDAAGVARLEPGVELSVAGGVYFPGDAQLDPGRTMVALQGWLERHGVRFLWHHEVCGWHATDRITAVRMRCVASLGADAPVPSSPVTTEFLPDTSTHVPSSGVLAVAPVPLVEELEVDDVVLAAGVWSEALAEQTGLSLPMRAGKGYSVTLPNPPQPLRTPMILAEARVALTPLGQALRVGGTMEVLSVKQGERGGVSADRVGGILRAVPRYLPAYTQSHLEGLPVWFGLRPISPDGLPYLGRSPRHLNLIVATGHAMMGISLGPITGNLVAELLADEVPSLPLEALRVDRFTYSELHKDCINLCAASAVKLRGRQ